MRRTGFSALALACAAVVAGAVPAFADGGTATPSPVPSEARPSAEPSAVPSEARPSAEPSTAPTEAPRDQVSVVPRGAADTGVAESSSGSGSGSTLIGGGAAAAVALGGGAFVVVRRRRANGA